MTTERHHGPALWLVTAAVAAATGLGALLGARVGGAVLVVALATAAIARLLGRGRRPVGVAVRSVWADVTVLAVLAIAIAALLVGPGVGPVSEDGSVVEDLR